MHKSKCKLDAIADVYTFGEYGNSSILDTDPVRKLSNKFVLIVTETVPNFLNWFYVFHFVVLMFAHNGSLSNNYFYNKKFIKLLWFKLGLEPLNTGYQQLNKYQEMFCLSLKLNGQVIRRLVPIYRESDGPRVWAESVGGADPPFTCPGALAANFSRWASRHGTAFANRAMAVSSLRVGVLSRVTL